MAASSSDEDELGTYDTNTTPYRVEKYSDATLKTTKPNGRAAVAGSSSRPPGTRQETRRKHSSREGDDDETERVPEGDRRGDTEVVEVPAFAPEKGRLHKRAMSREPDHPPSSLKPRNASRGKVKVKAKPESAREAPPEIMDVDNMGEVREESESELRELSLPSIPSLKLKEKQTFDGELVWKRREERDRKKIERLRRQLQDSKAQRDSLAAQLEEAFHTRKTELEERVENLVLVYESRIQIQEESIKEMTSQLARIDSLTREGKTSTLHFLTREAADEERRDIERQVDQLRKALREKENDIAERDAAIDERDLEIRTLKIELSAEVERSKSLAASRSNTRDPASRARMFTGSGSGAKIDTEKATNIHRLYEDMSNILFIDCKYETSSDSADKQWVYNCLYTHLGSKQSLNFSLRTYSEIEDEETVEKVAYTPVELSDDSPELMERLDFLAEEFTFQRKQLDVFMNRLYNAMNDAFEPSGSE
ncbi:hypothetical protein M0805_005967 [Coniferiporia weirii]|nr:hypothetical protein M0805_005967 [Coniferiporia weirii]